MPLWGASVQDSTFTLRDDADATKQAQFQLSGITTGTTRTYTLPNGSVTLAMLNGSQSFSGQQTFTGSNSTLVPLVVTPTATTALAAEKHAVDVNTSTFTFTTTPATERYTTIAAPTFAATAAGQAGGNTITTAATLAVEGAPIAGTNMTLTNTYALWVQGGTARFEGTIHNSAATALASALTLGTDAVLYENTDALVLGANGAAVAEVWNGTPGPGTPNNGINTYDGYGMQTEHIQLKSYTTSGLPSGNIALQFYGGTNETILRARTSTASTAGRQFEITGAGVLQFGALTTNAVPDLAVKRESAGVLAVRDSGDTAYRDVNARNITAYTGELESDGGAASGEGILRLIGRDASNVARGSLFEQFGGGNLNLNVGVEGASDFNISHTGGWKYGFTSKGRFRALDFNHGTAGTTPGAGFAWESAVEAQFMLQYDGGTTAGTWNAGVFSRYNHVGLTVNATDAAHGSAYIGRSEANTSFLTQTNASGFYAQSRTSSGTISNLHGFYAGPDVTSGATVTNRYGFRVADFGRAATTQYGLYVDAMTSGTTDYAIYTNAGLVRFGDDITLDRGSGTNTVQINLTARTGGAANTAFILNTGSQLQVDAVAGGSIGFTIGGLSEMTLTNSYADFQSNRIANLGAPTDPNDAATKTYVDSASGSSSFVGLAKWGTD